MPVALRSGGFLWTDTLVVASGGAAADGAVGEAAVGSSPSIALVLTLVARVAAAPGDPPPYCTVETPGSRVAVVRPADGEPPLDDVNWFARPVANAKGEWIVAVASHNLNYLYNLTTGRRIRIPDKSDAVATPDGRYITGVVLPVDGGTVARSH